MKKLFRQNKTMQRLLALALCLCLVGSLIPMGVRAEDEVEHTVEHTVGTCVDGDQAEGCECACHNEPATQENLEVPEVQTCEVCSKPENECICNTETPVHDPAAPCGNDACTICYPDSADGAENIENGENGDLTVETPVVQTKTTSLDYDAYSLTLTYTGDTEYTPVINQNPEVQVENVKEGYFFSLSFDVEAELAVISKVEGAKVIVIKDGAVTDFAGGVLDAEAVYGVVVMNETPAEPEAPDNSIGTENNANEAPVTYSITFDIGEEARAAGVVNPNPVDTDAEGNLPALPEAPLWVDEEGYPVMYFRGWVRDLEKPEDFTDETIGESVVLYAWWDSEPAGVATLESDTPTINPDVGSIGVSKVFYGATQEFIEEYLSNFSISVTPQGGVAQTLNLTGKTPVSDNGGLKYSWNVSANATTYHVVENNYYPDAIQNTYAWNGTDSSDVTITEGTVDVREVTGDNSNSDSKIKLPKNLSSNEDWAIIIGLTSHTGSVVLSSRSLEWAVRVGMEKKFAGGNHPLMQAGEYKGHYMYYSLEDYPNQYVYIESLGVSLEYDPANNVINVNGTNQWSNPIYVAYDVTAASNEDVNLTNTYTRKTTDVTIKKVVTGNFGDWNKKFSIKVTPTDGTIGAGEGYTVAADGSVTVSLSNEEFITLKDVTIGAKLAVSEPDDGAYTMVGVFTSWDGHGSEQNVLASTPYTVPNTPSTLIVENNREATIDTGIFLDTLPYFLILSTVACAAVVMMKARKKEA